MFGAKNLMATAQKQKSPVQYVGGAFGNAASELTVPAHQNGDIIVMWVGSWTGAISKPAAGGTVPEWIDLANNPYQGRLVYCIGTGSTTAGVWAYSYHVRFVVRGASGVGAFSYLTNASIPQLTLQDASSATSLVLGMAASTNNATWSVPSAPGWTPTINYGRSSTGNFSIYAYRRLSATTSPSIGLSSNNTSISWALEFKA